MTDSRSKKAWERIASKKQELLDRCSFDKETGTRDLISTTSIPEGTVRQYLRELAEKGYLKMSGVHGLVKHYTKLVDKYVAPPVRRLDSYKKLPGRAWSFIPYKLEQVAVQHSPPIAMSGHINDHHPVKGSGKSERVFVSGITLAGIV